MFYSVSYKKMIISVIVLVALAVSYMVAFSGTIAAEELAEENSAVQNESVNEAVYFSDNTLSPYLTMGVEQNFNISVVNDTYGEINSNFVFSTDMGSDVDFEYNEVNGDTVLKSVYDNSTLFEGIKLNTGINTKEFLITAPQDITEGEYTVTTQVYDQQNEALILPQSQEVVVRKPITLEDNLPSTLLKGIETYFEVTANYDGKYNIDNATFMFGLSGPLGASKEDISIQYKEEEVWKDLIENIEFPEHDGYPIIGFLDLETINSTTEFKIVVSPDAPEGQYKIVFGLCSLQPVHFHLGNVVKKNIEVKTPFQMNIDLTDNQNEDSDDEQNESSDYTEFVLNLSDIAEGIDISTLQYLISVENTVDISELTLEYWNGQSWVEISEEENGWNLNIPGSSTRFRLTGKIFDGTVVHIKVMDGEHLVQESEWEIPAPDSNDNQDSNDQDSNDQDSNDQDTNNSSSSSNKKSSTTKIIDAIADDLENEKVTVDEAVENFEEVINDLEGKRYISSSIKEAVQKIFENIVSKAKNIASEEYEATTLEKETIISFPKEVIAIKVAALAELIEQVENLQQLGIEVEKPSSELKIELPLVLNRKLSVQLTGDDLKALKDNQFEMVISNSEITLNIPSESIIADQRENIKIGMKRFNDEELVESLKGYHILGFAYDFTLDGDFINDITVEMSYDPSKLNDASRGGVYYFNPKQNEWEYVGGVVKKDGSTVSFNTNHFSTYAVLESHQTFLDIQSHWAKNEIEILTARKIVNGYTEETFSPNKPITRAEFTALIVRALGIGTKQYSGQFEDVSKRLWYADAIEAAFQQGFVKGMSNNNFEPEKVITREEMAVILVRAYDMLADEFQNNDNDVVSFKDINSASSWSQKAIKTVSEMNIMRGNPNGNFYPNANTTRAEAAVTIYRILN